MGSAGPQFPAPPENILRSEKMSNKIFTRALCAAAAIAVTATGFSASANAQARTVRTAVVDFADLDLTSEDGQSTLQGRLKGAVRKVCGSYDSKNLTDARDHDACMDEASASAQRASVTIMAAVKSGKPVKTAMAISN
jgi:UrcA family protein